LALTLDDLSEEVLVGATAAAKRRWSDATVARMLSTLRGFTRWAQKTDPAATSLSGANSAPTRLSGRQLQ
jgi:hypothetical protein